MRFGHWLGLICLVAALLLLWNLRETVVLIFAAVILAMALCTLVGTVQQRLQCRRPFALVLSLLALALVAAIVATAIIPPFLDQFGELIHQLPQAGERVVRMVRGAIDAGSRMLYGSRDGGLSWLQQEFSVSPKDPSALTSGLSNGIPRLLGLAGNVGNGLLQTLFVVAVALMVAAQPAAYREALLMLVPSFYRRRFRTVLLQCGDALSAWMVGVMISSVCVGGLAALGLWLLGVKLVAACAVLAGVLNVIPNVGPTLSTLFPMSVALLDSPWKAIAVLGLYVLVQNLESYLITPSVMHHQLRLLPGLTLCAQLLFTVLFGPMGLILALPLAVCLQVILKEVLIHDVLNRWKPARLQDPA